MPCLAHVLNLAVQAMLGKGGLEAQAPNTEEVESMDAEDDDDAEGFIRTSIVSDEEEDAAEVPAVDNRPITKNALRKLRTGIVKIR